MISNELVADSDPSALEVVGGGLVRDLQVRLDSAFFGNTVANGPNGLASLADVQTVDAGSTVTDLDWAAEALSKAETVGSTITSFVASATVLALSTIKIADTYTQPRTRRQPGMSTK